jgi:hypothetical protein
MRQWKSYRRALMPLGVCLCLTSAASALDVSPDTSLVLDATTVNDEDVARLNGSAALVDLGTLPLAADANAYWAGDGFVLFSLDKTVTLAGGVRAEPMDVVRFENGSYSLEFDGSSNGVTSGVVCDAVARDHAGNLLLSFDTSVSLPGNLIVDDEDIVRLDGVASYSLFFDASAAGISAQLDLDGADLLLDGNVVMSFDGSGSVDGIPFDDEDVLEFNPSTLVWSLHFDTSTVGAWNGPDVNAIAVPEPGMSLALLFGFAGALVLRGKTRVR